MKSSSNKSNSNSSSSSNRLFELLQAETPNWVEVLAASTSVEDAKYVDPDTHLTPLHLAVTMMRANPPPLPDDDDITKNNNSSSSSSSNEARVAAIRSLLQSDLSSTEVTCLQYGYTPLMYACCCDVVRGAGADADADDDLDFEALALEYQVPVVKLLMEYNPQSVLLKSPLGQTALDIHIVSMSRLHNHHHHHHRVQEENEKEEAAKDRTENSSMKNDDSNNNNNNNKARKKGNSSCRTTCLLDVLLEYDIGTIVVWKSLELLLSCNTLQVMDYVAKEDANALRQQLEDRRQKRMLLQHRPNEIGTGPLLTTTTTTNAPGSRGNQNKKKFQGFWVWEFLLAILKSEHQHTYRGIKPVPPFNALHTASQMDDFPLALLILCMRAYPAQVRTPSVIQAGDLPIHSVAGWEVLVASTGTTTSVVDGGHRPSNNNRRSSSSWSQESSKVARKSMALVQLLSVYPDSCHQRNAEGKTPLSLAIETGTAWNGGVRRLLATASSKDKSSSSASSS